MLYFRVATLLFKENPRFEHEICMRKGVLPFCEKRTKGNELLLEIKTLFRGIINFMARNLE